MHGSSKVEVSMLGGKTGMPYSFNRFGRYLGALYWSVTLGDGTIHS